MRTPSGILHIVDFKTSQIVSAIQPKDYWDDKRHWEIKNNIDTLEFRVFDNTEHAATLLQQNLVLKEVRDGRIVPYVITEAEKDSKDRSVVAYASGEWIQLAKAGIINPQKIEGKTLNECMGIALAGTKWKIGKMEHNGSHSMTIDEFTDPLTFLKQIASSFELEIQYRAEVVGSQIVGRYVDMVKKRGRDTRKEVTLGKDLMGIKRIENSQNICTALLGFVKKEGGEFITIAEINNGIPYLVDDGAFQRWNEKGQHKFGFYSPETENQDMTPQRLKTLMKTEIEKRVNTSVSYEVQAQSIGQVFGLAHELINEGDTIRIIDKGFTPKLYLEARAIAGDESFKDPIQDKYVFGDYREIIDSNEELRRMYQKILASLQDKVPQGWFDALKDTVKNQGVDIQDAINKSKQAQQESKIAKDLAEATQDYMAQNLVDIIESAIPPTANLKDGKTLWSDNSDPANKVLKLWKGGAWLIISPDTKPLNTALTQAQNDITKAKQDIITGQNALTSAKSEIQGNINTEKQRITDLTTNVNKKVDQTWIDQQLTGKADQSGVYDKNYIDSNVVGKQTYETDKAGNVQKFTDMNTDITRNATAIKSKAEQSSLDTTNSNLKGVTNRVTTVEQTATGLTTRIGIAEGKINTATGDITNLKTKTNTIEQTANGSVQKIEELTGRFDGMSIGSVNMIQGTEEIFNNPSATGNYNGFKSTPPPFPKYNIRGKELTISMYLTGKITAKGNNPWLGMEISIQFVDGTATQYLNGRIDNKIELNKDYVSQRFVNTVKVNDKEIKVINVTMGARDLTGSIRLHNGQIEEGNQATAWKLSPEELTTTQQFTQKTNEIINTVDQNAQKLTAVETTMKNTKYGRDNLIPNSGMFSNTGGWMANTPANSTMEVVTEDGFNAMKIKGSIRASSPVILKPDTEYVYSALIKIPVDNVISDGSGNPLHFWSTIGENPHTAVQRAILEPASKKILANTWTRVSYKFKTLAGAENTLFTPFMYSQEIINSNAFAYVRYFQLVEGNQITEDWQAPSGDIVKKTNEIVQTIDSTISRVTAVENRRTGSDNLLKVDSARWVVHPKNTGTDADNFNYANLPVNMQLNRTYTVSARVKFTAGTDTHISVYPYPNGSQQHIEIKDGFITHTFKKTNASTVGILLYAGKSATTRSKGVEFTEIMVTEGDGVVAYAPPSPTLDVFTSKTNEITQTVDANKQKISSIESTVSAINDDVTNLFMDAGSFKGYSTTYDPLKRWLLKGAGARISADTFQDNAVAETQSSWSSLCYNFKDLADRGVVKVGDILNVSIYMRIKGLPAGQTKVVSYFFRGRNNAKSFNVSNTWARYDVETTVTADMLTVSGAAPESYMRFEVNENTGGTAWFQQSQPQLTIGTKLYTWRTAPEDISVLVVKTNEIIQTVDTNMLTITKAVQGGGENFLYKSSGEKGEIAVLHDDSAYTFNGCTRNATNMDHIQFTCSSYSDAFYQIGATNVNLMHGFSAGETLTLSFDQKQDLTGMQTIIFQHDGTSWSEAEAKTYAQLSWSRESHTFTLKPNTKGWFIRFRFPRVAEANTKNIWLAKLKLEAGSIKSPWSPNSIETMRTQNTLKQDVDSLSSNITSVSNRTGSLETKSNNLQQSLDGTISKVNTLTTTQTNQGTQITQQGSQITQLSNQIDLRVKTTEMQDYVGALGNNNIIMNSAFEDRVIHPTSGIVTNRTPSTTKWTLQGVGTNKTVAADSSVTHEGYNSVKMSSSGYTGSQFVGVSQTLPVTAGSGDYVFSAWFYVTNKALLETEGGVIKLQFFNGSTGSTSLQTELLPKLVNNTWVRLSAKITAPATPVTALRADIWIRRNGVLYAAQPLLQQGSTPSTFMENPKDYANYDQLVGEVAKKVATTEFNSKVSTLETSMNQQSNRIDLKAEKTDVYTKKEANGQFGSKAIVDSHTSSIALMAGEITQRVKNNEVASTINQTAQSVLIQANKINLDGAVTAKSIESGRLAGVTISTSTNSTGYFVDMNQQNISLKSNVGNTGPITRGYLGFMPNLPDNTVRTALVLGNNYDNANRLEVNGSLFLEQQTPKWNNYDLSNCRIGMARSRNSDGSINMKSSIKMGYMGSIEMRSEDSDIDLDAKGHIRMNTTRGSKSLNDIQLVSGTSMSLDAYNGSWFLNSSNSKGADEWRIRTLYINDKRSGGNTQADVDFRMGHLVTLRIPQHPDYTKYGLQVKKGDGNSLSNIHVDKVYLTQNMWESTRQVKTAIKEIEVDPLETLMQLQPKQYYRKSEMQKLYEKREKIVAGGYQKPMPTIKDIPLEYGFIAEEIPECLATEDRKTVSTYPLMTIGIAGTQEIYKKHLALEEIVKEQANQLAIQEDRIARLEELLLQQLIDKKPEQP